MGAAGATAAEATVTAAAAAAGMREGGDRGNKNRTADEAVGCRSNTREGEWRRRRRARGRGDESKGATAAAAAATGEELEVKQFSEVEQLVCLGVGTQIIMKTVWKSNA